MTQFIGNRTGNNGSSLEGSRTLYISALSLHYGSFILGDFGPDETPFGKKLGRAYSGLQKLLQI